MEDLTPTDMAAGELPVSVGAEAPLASEGQALEPSQEEPTRQGRSSMAANRSAAVAETSGWDAAAHAAPWIVSVAILAAVGACLLVHIVRQRKGS